MLKKVLFRLGYAAILLTLTSFGYTQEHNQPIVRQITAFAVSQNHIEVQWKLPAAFKARSILIYRDSKPIATKAQIAGSTPLAEIKPESNFYVDTVKTYASYYYAVLARTADGKPYDIILPSINATTSGVHVERKETPVQDAEITEEKLYADGQMRELPLPYLNMLESQNKKPNALSPAVVAAGKSLALTHAPQKRTLLPPHVFDEDMVSPPGGDEYYLFEILKDYFIKRNYPMAVKQLQIFLGANRSKEVTTRGAFYLGESLYFCRRYREALMMFLFVEDDEPALAKKWIQSTLDLYNLPAEKNSETDR